MVPIDRRPGEVQVYMGAEGREVLGVRELLSMRQGTRDTCKGGAELRGVISSFEVA